VHRASEAREFRIEDLLAAEDYLRLYNWAFNTNLTTSQLPQTSEPILRRIEQLQGKFDHALPSHAFTDRREEFAAGVDAKTLDRFEVLFQLLNGTIQT
jgi:hypothetical protein